VEPPGRLVAGAPRLDMLHVEAFRSLHSQNVPRIVEIFIPTLAEFLDNDVLCGRQPGFGAQHWHINFLPAFRVGVP